MREEVLAKMEAVRVNPKEASTPTDFQFEALKVRSDLPCWLDEGAERDSSRLVSTRVCPHQVNFVCGSMSRRLICMYRRILMVSVV